MARRMSFQDTARAGTVRRMDAASAPKPTLLRPPLRALGAEQWSDEAA